jgi:hypothetical protein
MQLLSTMSRMLCGQSYSILGIKVCQKLISSSYRLTDLDIAVGLNFGVQLAWVCISCLTLPLFQWYVRRQEVAAWRKENARGE